jgi:LmbE family N-acetylglucosaminyl deacetylase
MTGHPDHITIGDWAVEAAATVCGARCRVLAATKTPDWLDAFAHINQGVLAPEPPCTPAADLAVDIALSDDTLDVKMRALRAQASQTSGLLAALGESTYRAWISSEFWVTRYPSNS